MSGRGLPRGCLLVGDDFDFIEGRPSSLRVAVEGCKADIHLVKSARVPRNWASSALDLFSVAHGLKNDNDLPPGGIRLGCDKEDLMEWICVLPLR